MLRTLNPMLGPVARARPSRSMSSRPGLGSRDAEGGAMHVAMPYLMLPGASGDYASTPDAAVLDITGDIEIAVLAALDDWTPPAVSGLVGKWTTDGDQRSYGASVNTNGTIFAYWSPDGSSSLSRSFTAPTVNNGEYLWIKITLDVDDGAGNRVALCYVAPFDGTTDEPTSWTAQGSTTPQAGTTSIYAGSGDLNLGRHQTGGYMAGKIARAIIRSGIGGTTVFDFDPSIAIAHGQTSIIEQSGNDAVVTVNGGAVLYAA